MRTKNAAPIGMFTATLSLCSVPPSATVPDVAPPNVTTAAIVPDGYSMAAVKVAGAPVFTSPTVPPVRRTHAFT